MGLTMSMRKSLHWIVDVVRILTYSLSTGETPWIKLIIEKFHETAKANGAIVRFAVNSNYLLY